jgi:hypothetical protein
MLDTRGAEDAGGVALLQLMLPAAAIGAWLFKQ